MTPIRSVVFDLDGLMIDTEPIFEESARRLLARRERTPLPHVLQAMMGTPARDALKLFAEAHGLCETVEELRMESSHEEGGRREWAVATTRFSGNGAVERLHYVRVGDSTGAEYTLDADLVLLATGLRPNAEIAFEAGVARGVTGAIAVDERMQTSLGGVYAAGDCAELMHLVTGRPAYIPLGTSANKSGRVAGANAAGGRERFPGIVGTSIVGLFDVGNRSHGERLDLDRTRWIALRRITDGRRRRADFENTTDARGREEVPGDRDGGL